MSIRMATHVGIFLLCPLVLHIVTTSATSVGKNSQPEPYVAQSLHGESY